MSESIGRKLPEQPKETSAQTKLDILLKMREEMTDEVGIKNNEQLIKELLEANPELKKPWH